MKRLGLIRQVFSLRNRCSNIYKFIDNKHNDQKLYFQKIIFYNRYGQFKMPYALYGEYAWRDIFFY